MFDVVDGINEKMEKIKSKRSLDVMEVYFDDGLRLRIIIKNKSSAKFPLKNLQFEGLTPKQKRIIIQILNTKL